MKIESGAIKEMGSMRVFSETDYARITLSLTFLLNHNHLGQTRNFCYLQESGLLPSDTLSNQLWIAECRLQ